MGRTLASGLRLYLIDGLSWWQGCAVTRRTLVHRGWIDTGRVRAAHNASIASPNASTLPLYKQLKDEAKQARINRKESSKRNPQIIDGWELTVGIEIHAQLNTARKLFSPALTSFNDEPNSHVAFFDVAIPGSQPLLQKEVLVPAIRAALALNCDIHPVSRFDRKHYFWWDQPSGYQITQYYHPFASKGHLELFESDEIAPEDGKSVVVGIKQMQLEQDTAKTLAHDGNMHLLDFNRVGLPLVEIITDPDMHHPRTAAVFVRKIQQILGTVDSCVSGMETGGLRADVNVSVRRTDDPSTKLGARTEIKNLNTVKAVEDAIIAERDRHIAILQAGGTVKSETRGWTLGGTETHRLRGKEGEIDYRYMPDPDIAPLVIGSDLVEALRASLAVMPDKELEALITDHGLTQKDAKSLMALESGARVEYFYRVLQMLHEKIKADFDAHALPDWKSYSTLAANWIIHTLGHLTGSRVGPTAERNLDFTNDGECLQVPASALSTLLHHLYRKRITIRVAKELLMAQYHGELEGTIDETIDRHGLWFKEISEPEYVALADQAMGGEEKVLGEFRGYKKFPQGKLMYLVGKMMRMGPMGRIDPAVAEKALRGQIERLQAS